MSIVPETIINMINVILKNNLARCPHALHCLILQLPATDIYDLNLFVNMSIKMPKIDTLGDDYNLENNLDNQS